MGLANLLQFGIVLGLKNKLPFTKISDIFAGFTFIAIILLITFDGKFQNTFNKN